MSRMRVKQQRDVTNLNCMAVGDLVSMLLKFWFSCLKGTSLWDKLFVMYANNKTHDMTALQRSHIGVFRIRYQDNMSFVVRKLVFGISDQVRNKPGYKTTQDG